MPALRVGRSALLAVQSPSLRVGRSGMTVVPPATTALRVGRSGMTVVPAIIVNALPNLTVEPTITVSVTASMSGGGTPDSTVWRVVSGDPVSLSPSLLSCTFTSPAAVDALKVPRTCTTVIGVTATVGGVTSTEKQFTVTSLPETLWYWNGTFVPRRRYL